MSGLQNGPYRNRKAKAYADGGEAQTRFAILSSITTTVHEEWAAHWIEAFEQWLSAHSLDGYDAFAGFPARGGRYYCFVLADEGVKERVSVVPYAALEGPDG